MPNGIYTAMTGALAQERAMDVIANNLANVNTAGFKATRLTFADMVTKDEKGRVNETQHHVVVDGSYMDFSPGSLEQTNNPLDVAIMGDGFFEVETEQGLR